MKLASLFAVSLLSAASAAAQPVTVTPANFARAETDGYFASVVARGGFGQFTHRRELASAAQQGVVRPNTDTVYSSAVFDLDAGPVTVRVPDSGSRFVSLMVLNEDHYAQKIAYGGGTYTIDRALAGTRYAVVSLRILVDPGKAGDLDAVHALQDGTIVEQPGGPGSFAVPAWDPASRKQVKEALIALGATLPNLDRAFGRKDEVDPVEHLIGAAIAWGGNPRSDAAYLNITPPKNDGRAVYRLRVGEVPVDAFWSVTVYDREGQLFANPQGRYSINSLSAKRDAGRNVTLQFGACTDATPNCLPTVPGWNYMVRLYRPRAAFLSGQWTFPEAVPASE
jgi:hypothetical protein